MDMLSLLAINITERCNLACDHCYMDASRKADSSDELSLADVCLLLDTIAARSVETMVVLTGGEPLLRKDVEDMVSHGSQLGLSMVIGTNGLALSENRITGLKQAGLLGVGISIDSLDADKHDAFRGQNGSWQKTLNAISHCRAQQMSFQLHFTLTEDNADEIEAMVSFAKAQQARVLNFFFIVCTGRAESMTHIDPLTYEEALHRIIKAQQQNPEMIIRARCAPHFKRIAHQQDPKAALNKISGFDGDGCIAGTSYCRVTSTGEVTACPFIEESVGSIKEQDFWSIWDDNAQFALLRQPKLEGSCGICEYRKLCGGCRARPKASLNNIMASDAFCAYSPRGGEVIEPLAQNENNCVIWTPEALERLERIPSFLRAMIKKRAQAYVSDLGLTQVEAKHLQQLAAKRFGGNAPGKKPSFVSIKNMFAKAPNKAKDKIDE